MKVSGKNSPPPSSLSNSSGASSPQISYQFRWPTRKSQRRRRRQILEQNFVSSLEEKDERRNLRNTRTLPQVQQVQQEKTQQRGSKQVVFRPAFRPGTPPPSVPIRAQALGYDPNRLAPPSAYEIGLTKWEAPPHKRVCSKKWIWDFNSIKFQKIKKSLNNISFNRSLAGTFIFLLFIYLCSI